MSFDSVPPRPRVAYGENSPKKSKGKGFSCCGARGKKAKKSAQEEQERKAARRKAIEEAQQRSVLRMEARFAREDAEKTKQRTSRLGRSVPLAQEREEAERLSKIPPRPRSRGGGRKKRTKKTKRRTMITKKCRNKTKRKNKKTRKNRR